MMPSAWASAGVAAARNAMGAASVIARRLSIRISLKSYAKKNSMGVHRLGAGRGHLQPQRQPCRTRERGADTRHAGWPAVAFVEPAEYRRAGETAEEIAREINSACGAAIRRCGAAD